MSEWKDEMKPEINMNVFIQFAGYQPGLKTSPQRENHSAAEQQQATLNTHLKHLLL